jgi:hypothetical protein
MPKLKRSRPWFRSVVREGRERAEVAPVDAAQGDLLKVVLVALGRAVLHPKAVPADLAKADLLRVADLVKAGREDSADRVVRVADRANWIRSSRKS